jgi:uncharacterized alkaline shock family protein YloU
VTDLDRNRTASTPGATPWTSTGTGSGTGAGPISPAPPPRQATAVERADAMFDQARDAAGEAVERAAAVTGRVASDVIGRIRNDAELGADRGSTRIEDEVVEKIAGIAAREVPGVHDLGGDAARFFASMKQRVGLGEGDSGTRGVSAKLDGRTARVGVTLVVDYGIKVQPVTEQVRAKVIEAVERMLDLQVTEVNIVVDDVAEPSR